MVKNAQNTTKIKESYSFILVVLTDKTSSKLF